MLKLTRTEILALQVGQRFGPYLATRKEIHRAQANLSNHTARYPGARFENHSTPAEREQPDGSRVKMPGWFNFSVTRISTGVSADTGEEEPVATAPKG